MIFARTDFLKKTGALGLAFVMAAGSLTTGLVTPPEADAHHHSYRGSSIVVEAGSGKVYSENEADAPRYPASLTKIMTMIVAFDALKAGKISLETKLDVPRAATRTEKSKLGLKKGQRISVGEAISAMTVKSANDAAVTLACGVAGSEEAFVERMNEKAQDIGLEHTHFSNASGLHNRDQVTTARDMAKLANHLIKEYPDFYEYFSQREFAFKGQTHDTHNRLMKRYPGMDGVKTGYINASGHNLVSSAVFEDYRMVGVVFGGHSPSERDEAMAVMLNAAFREATGGNAPVYDPPEERGPAWFNHFFPARNRAASAASQGGVRKHSTNNNRHSHGKRHSHRSHHDGGKRPQPH